MNKKFTRALLSATILGSGIIGAGSVIAHASDDDAGTTTPVALEESTAPTGLQAVDDENLGTTGELAEGEGADDRRGRGCGGNEAVAEILGLTSDELHEAREAGSTLAAIAASQGVGVDEVVQAIVDGKSDRLDEKVAAGELTADEAQERLAAATERAVEKVNGTREG